MSDIDITKAAPVIDVMPPIPARQAPALITERLGTPGYAITNGYILPKDGDPRLTGSQFYRIGSDQIVNVGIVGTAVRYFLDLVAGASWTFSAADDSAKAAEIADLVEDILTEDMQTPWPRVIRRAAMYKYWGFSLQEWTMVRRPDGYFGFADIEPRPSSTIERWHVDAQAGVVGAYQLAPSTGAEMYLPIGKMLYLTDDSITDSPAGLGWSRHIIRLGASLLQFEDLEALGFATDLQGIPIARAPLADMADKVRDGDMSPETFAERRAVLEQFIQYHWRGQAAGKTQGLLLDSKTYENLETGVASNQYMWGVDLLKSGGTSHAQINEAIKRKTFEIARLLGAEHLLIGADGGGSLALHSSSTRRMHGMVNSCLSEITSGVNRQIIRPLMAHNNIPKELWPKAAPEKVEYRTVEEVTGALTALATAGSPLLPDDPAVNAVRETIGLPPQPAMLAQIEAATAGLRQMGAGAEYGGDPEVDGAAGAGSRQRQPRGGRGMADPSRIADGLRAYLEGAS